MNFGQPNVEIGRKMANGQLLFLALDYWALSKHLLSFKRINVGLRAKFITFINSFNTYVINPCDINKI